MLPGLLHQVCVGTGGEELAKLKEETAVLAAVGGAVGAVGGAVVGAVGGAI